MASDLDRVRLGFKEIMEISKPRIVVLLVITAVTSMYAANKLVPDAPQLDYWAYLHIIIAGALASAGSSALNHYYDKDIDLAQKIIISKNDLVPGSGLIRIAKKKSYTINELCNLMIRVSDNTAFNKLINLINPKWLNKYLKSINYTFC